MKPEQRLDDAINEAGAASVDKSFSGGTGRVGVQIGNIFNLLLELDKILRICNPSR